MAHYVILILILIIFIIIISSIIRPINRCYREEEVARMDWREEVG